MQKHDEGEMWHKHFGGSRLQLISKVANGIIGKLQYLTLQAQSICIEIWDGRNRPSSAPKITLFLFSGSQTMRPVLVLNSIPKRYAQETEIHVF